LASVLSTKILPFLAYLLCFYAGGGWRSVSPSKTLRSFQTFFPETFANPIVVYAIFFHHLNILSPEANCISKAKPLH